MHYFQHDTQKLIWKIAVDPVTQIVVIELREDALRQVSFSAVNLADGSILWQDVIMEEPWWTSLSEAMNGRAFLFEYGDAQYPAPKGIIALDIHTGGITWQQPEIQLELAGMNEIVAFSLNGLEKQYRTLDASNGEIINAELSEIPTVQMPENHPLYIPHRYHPEHAHYATVTRFIQTKTGRKPKDHIDYVEHPNRLVINYHQQEADNTLTQWLLVTDLEGATLLDENTGKALSGMGLETFMVFGDVLVYIKDKEQLAGFRLS